MRELLLDELAAELDFFGPALVGQNNRSCILHTTALPLHQGDGIQFHGVVVCWCLAKVVKVIVDLCKDAFDELLLVSQDCLELGKPLALPLE